jgi:glycosyltransferase involved in cell wall biosynthesis
LPNTVYNPPPSPAAEPLRVLLVGPLAETGGLARVARQTTEGFDARRFAVIPFDASKDTPPGRSFLTACRSHLRRWGRLVRAIRQHRPAVIHLHTCSYGTFYRTLLDAATCRFFRIPYILHVHGGLFAEFLQGLRGLRRAVVSAGLRRAARIVVLSATWRTRLTQQVARLRIAVMPNALDALPRVPASPERRGGGVLFVGDLSDTKRPEDLLVAYAALPRELREPFPLTLVGDGEPMRRRLLTELTRRLDIAESVTFTGPLPFADVQRRLAEADVLVTCSRAEGMPLALLEAMAAGTAIIATAVGAVPEMVSDGQEALLISPQEPQVLTSALQRVLTDPSLRRELGAAARRKAEACYNPGTYRAALAALWSEVAARHAAQRELPVPALASTPNGLR